MLKRFLSFILISVFVFTLTNFTYASNYLKLEEGQFVYIEEVIDADSYVVSVNGKESLVKIVGVDINGYTRSKDVMESMLLSKSAYYRKAYYDRDDRWSYGNLVCNEVDIAKFMIENGLATVNKKNISESDATAYGKLEDNAKSNGYNFWQRNTNYANTVSADAININTASSAQLVSSLDIDEDLAYEIINYRKYNPFNNYLEVKFVPDMTSKIFEKIKSKYVVATNINSANKPELESIEGISSTEAEKIISGRITKAYTAETFKALNYMSDSQFEKASPYLYYTGNLTTIDYVIPSGKIININTASKDQITATGISSTIASTVTKATSETKYVFHNIGELNELSRVSDAFGEYNDFKYADNINFVTNINTATKSEIESLYGEYAGSYKSQIATLTDNKSYSSFSQISELFPTELRAKLEKIIVFEDDETDYVNLNTATSEQLQAIGLTSSEASSIISDRRIYDFSDISKDITKYADKISIYTNLNTASSDEIQRLSVLLTSTDVSAIVFYRDKELFGNIEEVETFFNDIDKEDVYKEIYKYISVR